MENKKLISIIVPCYNVEKYVDKSINSILAQTYDNLEIIAIDDCSTDGTYDILKKIAKKYDNIKLYKNDVNRGLAYTRNYGVSKALGKYIGFIDADDYIGNTYYEELMKKMEEEDADLIVNDIQLVDEEYKNIGQVNKACIGDISKLSIIDNGLCASACNKLLRKDLLIKYPFLEGKINEDVASIIPIIVNSDKISYTDRAVYNYVQRSNSIQNSKFSEKRFDMFDSIKVCLDRIKDPKDYEVYKDIIVLHQLLEIYIYILIEIEDEKDRINLISKFMEKLKEYEFELWNLKCLKSFIRRHRKILRPYYYVLIKLLKQGNVNKINSIIKFKKNFRSNINKLLRKNKEVGKYDVDGLIRLAKKQYKMKNNGIRISVVIPNYNYEKFLIRRIYSVLAQNLKIYELIILDDSSKDGSRELIDNIYNNIKDYVNVRKVYNNNNSGSAFKQWAKGIEESNGDYIWIAEADDYCDRRMLKNLVSPIKKDKDVYISYVDTAFTDKNGNIFLKSIKPEIDIMKTGHWNQNYISSGINEIENYTFLNNTIANVSSCIIKKDNYSDIYEEAGNYRQSGDWIFYVNIMLKGKIAYTDKVMNFYRVHEGQITSQMDRQKHFDEINRVYKYMSSKFGTNEFQTKKRKERCEFLKRVWNLNNRTEMNDNV